jgi:hypothetical protein
MGGKRVPVDTNDLHSAEGSWVSMQDVANGVYFFQGLTAAGQTVQAKAVWMR